MVDGVVELAELKGAAAAVVAIPQWVGIAAAHDGGVEQQEVAAAVREHSVPDSGPH